jgi:hypothetical protein
VCWFNTLLAYLSRRKNIGDWKMKYIIFISKDGRQEIPIIFPNNLVHLEVAQAMSKLVGTSRVVAAGEFSSLAIDAECNGKSTTIGVKSREEQDDRLISNYDYTFGFVS